MGRPIDAYVVRSHSAWDVDEFDFSDRTVWLDDLDSITGVNVFDDLVVERYGTCTDLGNTVSVGLLDEVIESVQRSLRHDNGTPLKALFSPAGSHVHLQCE
ncbi:hypothetical protein HYW59_02410 [Candidatus Kaiserbacteria bacterium]|nr:hypothetical protein [Candidatus Kaiserbacteria bacterium]